LNESKNESLSPSIIEWSNCHNRINDICHCHQPGRRVVLSDRCKLASDVLTWSSHARWVIYFMHHRKCTCGWWVIDIGVPYYNCSY